jgi:hypothetical protein
MESSEKETPAQRYRKTDKCKEARKRYYEAKGKQTSHEYYLRNRELINERSKARYASLKAKAENNLTE